MGTQTLGDWRNDLAKHLSRVGTLDPAEADRWVNNSILELTGAFKFPEFEKTGTINTVNGQVSYDLPADFRAFDDEGVRITSPQARFGGTLPFETRKEYRRSGRFATSANYGTARAVHKFGGKLWIRPTPDATVMVIEFDYHSKVTKLVAPGDVSQLPDEWDECIFRGALYRGHLRYGEHDRVINVFNLYLSLVRSRIDLEDLEEFPEGGISAIQSQFDMLRH